MKTLEEKIAFLKKCETGFVTDVLNLLGIRDCWVEGVLPVKPTEKPMVGEAFTVRLTLVRDVENPKNLYDVVDQCPAGQVLIASDIKETFLIGVNLLTRAANKGVEGVVLEAKNRDVADIRKMSMPVFSQGVGVRFHPTTLKVHCETSLPIDFGGAKIYPGDIIIGDDDGVVIIPRSRLDEVLYQVENVAEVEKELSAANRDKPDMSLADFAAILEKKKKLRQ